MLPTIAAIAWLSPHNALNNNKYKEDSLLYDCYNSNLSELIRPECSSPSSSSVANPTYYELWSGKDSARELINPDIE